MRENFLIKAFSVKVWILFSHPEIDKLLVSFSYLLRSSADKVFTFKKSLAAIYFF